MGSPGIEPAVGSVTSREAGSATAWIEIERLVEDVSALARQATSPGDFYGPMLTRLVPLLTAVGGAVWSHDSSGGFRLVCQTQLPDGFVAAGSRGAHGELLLQAVREGQPLRASWNTPAALELLLCPILLDGQAEAVIEIAERPADRPLLNRATSGCWRRCAILRATSTAIGNWLNCGNGGLTPHAWKIICDRCIAASICRRRATRSPMRDGDCSAATESVYWFGTGAVTESPPSAGLTWWTDDPLSYAPWSNSPARYSPPESRPVLTTTRRICLPNGSGCCTRCSTNRVPGRWRFFRCRLHKMKALRPRRCQEALVVERFTAPVEESSNERRKEVVLRHGALALQNALEYRRVPFFPIVRRVSRVSRAIEARLPLTAVIAAAVALAAVLLMIMPADFRVEARGELQPEMRRDVFAPADGVVQQVYVDHAQTVAAGDLLLEMRQTELDFEFARVLGELQTAGKQLEGIQATRLSHQRAEETEDRNEDQLTAEEEELKKRVAGLEEQAQCSWTRRTNCGSRVRSAARSFHGKSTRRSWRDPCNVARLC